MTEKEAEVVKLISVKEAAKRLGVGKTSAYKLLANEPGVHRIYTPGSKKPMIKIEAQVTDRILRRTANP